MCLCLSKRSAGTVRSCSQNAAFQIRRKSFSILFLSRIERFKYGLEELQTVRLEDAGPDALQPAIYRWQTQIREYSYSNKIHRIAQLTIATQPKVNKELAKQHGRPTNVNYGFIGVTPRGMPTNIPSNN